MGAAGSYSTAVLYCPELNVDDLTATADAQAPSGAAPAAQGGLTFTSLLKRCLADPATQADSFAEQFLAPLVKQKLLDTQFESERERKEQEQEVMSMAAMITVSRRFILLTFACKVLSEVLGVPFDELAPATSLLQPLKAVVRPPHPPLHCSTSLLTSALSPIATRRSRRMCAECCSRRRPTCEPAPTRSATTGRPRRRRSSYASRPPLPHQVR